MPDLSNVEHMDADLDHVVRSVLRWLLPEATTLPDGDRLQELVLCAALHAYGEALEDPELEGLELRSWRNLLVGSALGWLAIALDAPCWTCP